MRFEWWEGARAYRVYYQPTGQYLGIVYHPHSPREKSVWSAQANLNGLCAHGFASRKYAAQFLLDHGN